MIRARLRAALLKWALGFDMADLVEELRAAVSSFQHARSDLRAQGQRLQHLERVAIVAVDPAQGLALRDHVDPYLDEAGIVLCTAEDAHVAKIRPLDRLTAG